MKRCISLSLLALAILVQSGCGKKNSDSPAAASNGTGNNENPQKPQTPEERWAGIGTYGYIYQDSSRSCDTLQHSPITRQVDFCQLVVDNQANNDCALLQRQEGYQKKCGNDFEATNVKPKRFSGYDDNLRGICETALAPVARFAKNSEYCEFLKNETLHQGCLTEYRASEFRKALCTGEF